MKNRRKIMKKLRSRSGASISMALLLFLVCSVLCSVILVAATAASGRIMGVAETDQRYYAVTSAAELLKEMFEGKVVTVERSITWKRVNTYENGDLKPGETSFLMQDETDIKLDGVSYGTIKSEGDPEGNGFALLADGSYKAGKTTITPSDGKNIYDSLLTDAALKSVQTTTVTSETNNYYGAGTPGAGTEPRIMTLTVSNNPGMNVTVKEYVNDNSEPGTVRFEISSAGTGTTNYKLELVFKADMSVNNTSNTTDDHMYDIQKDADGVLISYKYDTKTVKKTITTLKWKLVSVN